MAGLKHFFTEAHRRSVWRVLGVYLVTSSAGWQLINELTDRIGLPDWVPGFAVVLFIIGLPIIVATAFFQAGPPTAPTGRSYEPSDPTLWPQSQMQFDDAPQALAPPTRHHFILTWPRAIAGGIFAFLLLGVTAAGYVGMRNAGIGPFGSLVASGALNDQERVLVADFTGAGLDTMFTQAVSQAFRVSFEQSSVISIVDPAHVRDVLQRMSRDPKSHLDADLAREVAERDNIKAFITGDVTRAAGAYIITAKLATPAGQTLASFSNTAKDSTEVLDAVQKVSKKLRTKIGESLRRINNESSLEAVTTPSLEALRKYAQGVNAFDAGDFEHAVTLLQEAVALDSTFAMAWRKLAVAQGYGGNVSESVKGATKAYEFRDRLTPVERYQTIAYYYSQVTRDDKKTIEAYRSILDIQPDNFTALNNIGLALGRTRAFDDAIKTHQRQVTIEPRGQSGWLNLITVLIDANQLDSASKVLNTMGKIEPRSDAYYMAAQLMEINRGNFAEAAKAGAQAIKLKPSGRNQTATFWAAAAEASLHGRLTDAARIDKDWSEYLTSNDIKGTALQVALGQAFRDVMVRRDPKRALATLNTILASYPLAGIADPVDRPYYQLAQLYAWAGDADRARALVAEHDRLVHDVQEPIIRKQTDGMIALAAKNYALAQTTLAKAADMDQCMSCEDAAVAMAFEAGNQPDSAIARYEHYIKTPSAFRFDVDGFLLAPAHERLAELYDAKGDRANAAQHAAKFVELWQNADADLQPRVQAKRALLQRLSQEH